MLNADLNYLSFVQHIFELKLLNDKCQDYGEGARLTIVHLERPMTAKRELNVRTNPKSNDNKSKNKLKINCFTFLLILLFVFVGWKSLRTHPGVDSGSCRPCNPSKYA